METGHLAPVDRRGFASVKKVTAKGFEEYFGLFGASSVIGDKEM